jgi:hypothetical protein
MDIVVVSSDDDDGNSDDGEGKDILNPIGEAKMRTRRKSYEKDDRQPFLGKHGKQQSYGTDKETPQCRFQQLLDGMKQHELDYVTKESSEIRVWRKSGENNDQARLLRLNRYYEAIPKGSKASFPVCIFGTMMVILFSLLGSFALTVASASMDVSRIRLHSKLSGSTFEFPILSVPDAVQLSSVIWIEIGVVAFVSWRVWSQERLQLTSSFATLWLAIQVTDLTSSCLALWEVLFFDSGKFDGREAAAVSLLIALRALILIESFLSSVVTVSVGKLQERVAVMFDLDETQPIAERELKEV